MEMKKVSIVAALALCGCAQNMPFGPQWNADHTAAQYVDVPLSGGGVCRITPFFGGPPDNGWAWNQINATAFERQCVTYRRASDEFLPNNVVGTGAPVAYIAPAIIAGTLSAGGEIGAARLLSGVSSTINIAGSTATATGGAATGGSASATGGSASARATGGRASSVSTANANLNNSVRNTVNQTAIVSSTNINKAGANNANNITAVAK